MTKIKIGTRGSKLALIQTDQVKCAIVNKFPHIQCEIVVLNTTGDVRQDIKLADFGGKGLFVKELESAILERKVDLAVHSAKDVPSAYDDRLTIPCTMERASPYDVLVSEKYSCLQELPIGAKVATSSPRRRVQLAHMRQDLVLLDIRGNLGTRINKMLDTDIDALILAEAAMIRLGEVSCLKQVMSLDSMVPAIGQGVICVQCRKDDLQIHEILCAINHRETFDMFSLEREFMRAVHGNCTTPVGALALRQEFGFVTMTFMLSGKNGLFRESITCSFIEAKRLSFEIGIKLKILAGV